MRLAALWTWMTVLMAMTVIHASPVPDMMQLLRENDIQDQLKQTDTLVRNVHARDVDFPVPFPSSMDAETKAEAIKSQLTEIDELMHQVMNLTHCIKRPIEDQSKEGNHV